MLPYRVPELLPEDTSINITTPLHPQATYLSILILSGLFGATNKWAQERHVRTHRLLQWDKGKGIGVSPEEQPGLAVSGGSVIGDREDREKSSQTNPSEGCLIVTEFPAGVTLKNHPQEESWDVRKTFSGSICRGELRLAECVLRDPAWAFPGGILLHFYYSDGRINLFSIFLSPAQLHIICCCVARGTNGFKPK